MNFLGKFLKKSLICVKNFLKKGKNKMNETMVETCVLTLGELIYKDITIPDYQRPYVWGKEQVEILLNDLDEQMSENSPTKTYLLGSLILCAGKDNKTLEVVDGQQRLVTLALILRALEYEKNFLGECEFLHDESKRHIKENYEFIVSWFEARKDKCEFFKSSIKDKIEFICIKTPSIDDAFIFFDSVNAKGKRLEGYDLIKAFHLRALDDYSQKTQSKVSKSSLTAYFAKEFEKLAADGEKLKILINETLTPARRWVRHNSSELPYQMDIYAEFCKEIPQKFKTSPLISKNSLGILQNFVGGADFFEYLTHFHRLYERLLSVDFYKEITNKIWASGFVYNRYIYIMAVLIYLDKFPNGRVDYMLLLIARAVFSLRCSEDRIRMETARDFAKEILPIMYYASFEQELEANLCNFIDGKLSKEREFKVNEIGGGKQQYIDIMSKEYANHEIQAHIPKGE